MEMLDGISNALKDVFQTYNDQDWVRWIAEENDWNDDCDKYDGCL